MNFVQVSLARLRRVFALSTVLLLGTCGVALGQSDIIPPKSYTLTPGNINVADGSFVHSVTDLSIGPMTLQRSYRSGTSQPNDPPFGRNFSHNFDIYIASTQPPPPTTHRYPIVHMGGRASGVYSQNISNPSSISPHNLDAERGRLSWNGSQYVFVDNSDASGTIYTFSASIQASSVPWVANSRKIERIDFADGRRQTFSYTAGGHLKLVEDSSGFAILFDHNGNGDVVAACAFNRSYTYVSTASTCAGAALKTAYSYDGQYLTHVTDVLGHVTEYTNPSTGTKGVTCIKPPGYSTCTVSMNPGRITTQTLQDGGTWTMNGMNPEHVNNPDESYDYDGNNEAAVTDPYNVTLAISFTKSSPYRMQDANNNVTSFRFEGAHRNNDTGGVYTDGTFLKEATYPEGNKYQAQYLGPFRSISKETVTPKQGSSLANLVKDYGYGACSGSTGSDQNCAKPIWIKDPRGNQTDFTYALHGGLLTEMKPAPTAGAPRPLKVNTYEQRYAYVKDSGGALVAAATPIWVLTSETQCQAVAGSSVPECDNNAAVPKMVTTYQFGDVGTENSLRVRGMVVSADGSSRRTCYGYDSYARRISETRPNAGLSVCP